MKKGFTLVELMVVIVVIAILSGISMAAYTIYSNRSADTQAKSLVTQIKSAAEKYYARNQEYPTSTVLQGGNSPPNSTKYSTMASAIDTSLAGISESKFKLFPCSGTCTVPNSTGDFVYYLSKGSAAGSAKTYTINSCTFTFPSAEADGTSYLIAYKQKEDSTWKYYRSTYGAVSTSNTTTCPFSV